MKFILASLLALAAGPTAHATDLPANLELTLTCFASCERFVIKKESGQWIGRNEPVSSYTVQVKKTGQTFKMSASQIKITGAPFPSTMTIVYEGSIDDSGSINFGQHIQGQLESTGELTYQGISSKCDFTSRADLGEGTLAIKCTNGSELDFSGFARITERKQLTEN